MDESSVLAALAALAQAHRLRAFRALVVAGPAGLTPGALAEQLGIPANTLSFHLKALSQAGLVAFTREGRSLLYRAEFVHMAALLAYLTDHCCAGSPGTATPGARCAC